MAKVVIDIEDAEGIEIALDKRMSFGTSAGNDVQIDAEGVDAFHAVIFKDESGTFWVKHIANTGATLVNGHTANFTKLRDGDKLEMGSLRGTFFEHENAGLTEAPDPQELAMLEKLRSDREALEKEVQDLEVTLKARKDEVQLLEVRRRDLSADVEKDLLRAQAAERQNRDFSQALLGLKQQHQSLSQTHEQLKSEEAGASQKVKAVQEALQSIEAQHKERESKLQTLRDEELSHQIRLSELSKSVEIQSSKLQEVSNSLELQLKQLEVATVQVEEHRDLSREIEQARASKLSLEKEEKALRDSHRQQVEAIKTLENELKLLSESKSTLSPEVSALSKQRDDLQVSVDRLLEQQQAHQALTAEIAVATQKLSDLKEQVQLTESRLNEGCEWLIGQERVVRETREEIETLHANRARVNAECEALKERLAKWQLTVHELEQKHGRILGDLDQMQARTLHLSEIQTYLAQGESLWRLKEDQMERQFVQDQQVLSELRAAIEASQKELGAPRLEQP